MTIRRVIIDPHYRISCLGMSAEMLNIYNINYSCQLRISIEHLSPEYYGHPTLVVRQTLSRWEQIHYYNKHKNWTYPFNVVKQ